MEKKLNDNIMDYLNLRTGASKEAHRQDKEKVHNLRNGALFDGSYIEEFKGTDGITAFFLNNEDLIIEYLSDRDLTFTGVSDAVQLVFQDVLESEDRKLQRSIVKEEARASGKKEYRVNVRRIVREDAFVLVEATSEQEATQIAKNEACNVPPKEWDCYDCEYWVDDDAVECVEQEKEVGV